MLLEGKKRTENLLSISVATNEMKIKNKLDAIQMKKRIVKRLNTMSNVQPTKIASCKNNTQSTPLNIQHITAMKTLSSQLEPCTSSKVNSSIPSSQIKQDTPNRKSLNSIFNTSKGQIIYCKNTGNYFNNSYILIITRF